MGTLLGMALLSAELDNKRNAVSHTERKRGGGGRERERQTEREMERDR